MAHCLKSTAYENLSLFNFFINLKKKKIFVEDHVQNIQVIFSFKWFFCFRDKYV